MAAKIYSGIEGIELPEFSFADYSKYKKKCDKYIADLKAKCITANGRNDISNIIGEVIRFQVADGYAEYMIYSLKPLELIHIGTMDGYHCEMAELLTLKKVVELVERERKMKALFS